MSVSDEYWGLHHSQDGLIDVARSRQHAEELLREIAEAHARGEAVDNPDFITIVPPSLNKMRGEAENFQDPDEDQDPFDPRLLGASLDTADIIRLAGDGMSWEDTMAHIDQVLAEGENDHGEPEHDHSMAYHNPDCAGWPSCSGCGYLNADGEWRDGPTPPEDAPFQANRADGLPDDYTH